MRPWAVDLTISGLHLRVPALPAVDWIAAILNMEDDVLGLVLGLLEDEDSELLDDAMAAGLVDPDELMALTMDLVTTVGSRPWWVTMRLMGTMAANWNNIGAEMMYRGIDASKLSLSGWLDVLLLVMMRMLKPDEAQMFVMKLEMVPAQFQDQVPMEELEMSRDAFLSMG